ncbi:phosphatidate cytidylyltransferase [Puniceicoccales bacterium CK1056]|uniref:Phosphatidate cytidylyltransferase n=1 Tax=Oceanipulchritudo coccoides TaxID=2706888 RepID=A0A6B2M362_9BACT|nr:phosphatidate cytidylyltransferase [Oceanipulchritudo coccoides]NDV62752.1 phosphatidate cytidylyltransferase [Oceanipulchritudo coccoides]
MKQRIIATAILWAIVITLPLLLGKWGAFILIAAFGTGAFYELLELLRQAGRPVDRNVALPAFVVILLAAILIPPWILPPVAILAAGLAITFIASLFKTGVGSFGSVAMITVGALILMLMPFFTAALMVHESGIILAVWVVAVAKFGDVGALLTGLWIGKTKMAPAFSPKKTWEGLAGGVVLSVLVSVGFVLMAKDSLPAGLTILTAAISGVLICLAGVIGDLIESAFKREAKVKDSGTIIRGIGGVFDLADSLILAFPTAYFINWLLF